VWLAEKKYKPAINELTQALKLNPKHETARYNLALAQIALRNKAAALEQHAFLKRTNPFLAQQLYQAIYNDKVLLVGRQ
jgi:tetratricopeptide (TPR) repeat protein